MHSLLIPFLDSHIKSYDIENDYPSAFEHLTNYLAVRNYTSRHFDPIEIGLGKGEVGIDGVAVIINDTLITTFDKEFFEMQMIFQLHLFLHNLKHLNRLNLTNYHTFLPL